LKTRRIVHASAFPAQSLSTASLALMLAFTLAPLSSCQRQSRRDGALADYLKAKSHYAAGELEHAAALLESSRRKDPNLHQAGFMLGKTLFFQQSYAEAETTFTRLLKENPDHHESAIWLVRSQMQRGAYDEAREQLEMLLSYDAGDPRLAYLMAQICLAEDSVEDAIAFLQRAAVFGEELAKVHLELGRIYYRFQMDERALAELRLCLSLLPDGNPVRAPVVRLVETIEARREGPDTDTQLGETQ